MDAIQAEAEHVFARMELLSHGAVARLAPLVRGVSRSDPRPSGEAHPPQDDYRRQLAAATTDGARRQVLEQARRELRSWLRRPLVTSTCETAEQLQDRIVSDGEGLTVREVSVAMRCSLGIVRRARLAAGRSPELGRRVTLSEDRRAWARELAAAGLSLRQVEALTGVPRSTLSDQLRAR